VDEPGDRAARGPRVRSLVLQSVLLVALLGAVAFLIVGLVPGSGERLRNAAAGWVAVGCVLEVIACTAYAWLFQAVFSYGAYTTTFVRSGQIAVGELGAFAVVPTGIGGPVLRVWALMRGGMPFRDVAVRTVIHVPFFNYPYVLAALVLGMAVVLGVGPGHAPVAVALAPLGLVVGYVALGVAALRYVRRHPAEPRARWRKMVREVVRVLPDGLAEVPSRVRKPGALLGATGFWVGDCAVLVSAFHAAGGSAPIEVIVLAYMLGQLGNAVPLPGGVGGVEPLMLSVLTASGVDSALGAAAIVLYRFISLGTQATLGAVAVATLVPALRRTGPQA
jgi:uncharacterized membrane protein YbhN (UPF0104 family)